MNQIDSQTRPSSTWKMLGGAIRFRLWPYLFDNLALITVMLAWLMIGLITRAFFDLISGEAPAGLGLWTLIALLIVSAVCRTGGLFGRIRLGIAFNYQTQTLLHKNLLARLFRLPAAQALAVSPGDALSRFRDDATALPEFGIFLTDMAGYGVFALVSLLIMLTINPAITLLTLLPLLVVVTISHLATGRVERYRAANRQVAGLVSEFITEIFSAVQAIKLAGVEGSVIDHFTRLNEDRRRASLRDHFFERLLDLIFLHTGDLGISLILLWAAQALRAGSAQSFTVGDFALFVAYLPFVTGFISYVGSIWARYRQTGVAIGRLSDLLQGAPPESLIERGSIQPGEVAKPVESAVGDEALTDLEVVDLTYRYPDTQRGIEGINFRLKSGSVTVITGRIGSGKTTLLRTVLGLLPKEAGDIYWNGQRVEQPDRFFQPPRSAYTPQVPRLFSQSLRDNLLLGLAEQPANLSDAIQAAVLEADLQSLTHGLDTLIGPRGVKLSGGQVQRAAAARMFLRRPALLVFDDLSSALDVETERELWARLFSERAEDVTCLVVSHRRQVLQQADQIILLKAGCVEGRGRLETLMSDCEEMRRLWSGEVD